MAEQEIPSFADMQADAWSPGATTETAPTETTATPQAAAPATTEPVAAPAAAAPPQNDGFERYLAMQQAQQYQAQANQANQQAWNQWNELLTPPPVPTSKEEREKLVLDPNALADQLEKQNEWMQRAARALQGSVMQTRDEAMRAYQMGQAEAAALATTAIEASQAAHQTLQEYGYTPEQIKAGMARTEQALRQNPQSYLATRTDPTLFAGAIQYTLHTQGVRPQPGRAVASGGGIGYSPSAPPQYDPRFQPISAEALSKAERALGVRFTPQDLQNAGLARVQ